MVERGYWNCSEISNPSDASGIERVAHEAGAGSGQQSNRVNLSGGHLPRGCRVENRSARYAAPQQILALRTATLGGNEVREIRVATIYLRKRGDTFEIGCALPNPGSLIVAKEESLVLAVVQVGNTNGPADCGAKLVLAEFTPRRLEEVSRIQLVIAKEFPYVTVQLISTRLNGGVKHGAARPSDLGAVVTGLDFELLNSVDGRQHHECSTIEEIDYVNIVVNPVQQVIVLRGPGPVGGEAAAGV